MKPSMMALLAALLFAAAPARGGLLDELTSGFDLPGPVSNLDEGTTAKGLRDALAVGTERAVKAVAKTDGYFGNEAIKILLPDKIRTVVDFLGKAGFQDQVDQFILSMNRAAEKAAPKAAGIFADAVRKMTFEDARGILTGGETSATEYFRGKTREKIYGAFKPAVTATMSEAGVTRRYQELMGEFSSLPFMDSSEMDLDHYVTNKAMDGLFHMLGEEEKKIRQNPAARTTEILRKVFGK